MFSVIITDNIIYKNYITHFYITRILFSVIDRSKIDMKLPYETSWLMFSEDISLFVSYFSHGHQFK